MGEFVCLLGLVSRDCLRKSACAWRSASLGLRVPHKWATFWKKLTFRPTLPRARSLRRSRLVPVGWAKLGIAVERNINVIRGSMMQSSYPSEHRQGVAVECERDI